MQLGNIYEEIFCDHVNIPLFLKLNVYPLALMSTDVSCLPLLLGWLSSDDFIILLFLHLLVGFLRKNFLFSCRYVYYICINTFVFVTTWISVFLFNPVDYNPLMSLFVLMLRLPQMCPALQAGFSVLSCHCNFLCTSLLY